MVVGTDVTLVWLRLSPVYTVAELPRWQPNKQDSKTVQCLRSSAMLHQRQELCRLHLHRLFCSCRFAQSNRHMNQQGKQHCHTIRAS